MRSRQTALTCLVIGALLTVLIPVVSAYGDNGRDRDDHRSRCYRSDSDGRNRHGGKLDAIGLTADSRLICVTENRPWDARSIGRVSGLTADTELVGIDYRPATGNDGDRATCTDWATRAACTWSTIARGKRPCGHAWT